MIIPITNFLAASGSATIMLFLLLSSSYIKEVFSMICESYKSFMNNVRLKILFFASWYPNKHSDVLGLFVKNKARAVSTLCDVAVIYSSQDNSSKNTFDIDASYEENVFTVRVYFRTSPNPLLNILLYNIRFLQAYYLAWKTVKTKWGIPDLLHVHVADRAGLPALFFKWMKKIPYVITEHSTPDVSYTKGEKKQPDYSNKFLKKLIWKNCSIGSVDSTISKKFLEKIGITSKIVVIPNVVSLKEQLLQKSLKPSKAHKKIGLHISILIDRKNVRGIIQSASLLSSKRDDYEIHILGTGPDEAKLKDLAKDLNVLDRFIFFHGYVTEEQKHNFIAQSDFHILNSDEEGFSVVTAESLCYGIPVIITDCGGPEDFVTEKNGIIIKKRDTVGLSTAIEKMLDTARSYDRVTISSDACKRFSFDIIAAQTLDMYRTAKIKWKAGNTGRSILIPPDAKVLDVGSGHQPHRRANVLLDKYTEGTIHRTTQELVRPSDKEFVEGDALDMPFKDKSFDMIIASHIAEHVDDPEKFCKELSRVGKKGYIETPGPLTEYLMPTKSHQWIVSKSSNKLVFRKNHFSKSQFPFFFRFFYLNREGYVENTWKTSNKILILFNTVLIKLWFHIPYAYTCMEWEDSIVGMKKPD
jgi:glycosyltransferase involved in cell wall biosynthesis